MIDFPAVEAGEPLQVSASLFVVFRQCPDAALARLEGRYGPESRASFTGGLAHRLFARHLRGEEIPPERLPQVCREEIGASNLNFKMGALGMKPSSLGKVIEEVGALYDRFRRFPMEGFRSAEVALEAEPVDGVRLLGTVDAVFEEDGTPRLVDWKTGGLGDALPQLLFYALLWVWSHHEAPGAVEAVSVRTGERFSQVPSRADLTETAAAVADLVNRVRRAWAAGEQIARYGGPWCRYCPLLSECSEGRSAAAVGTAAEG